MKRRQFLGASVIGSAALVSPFSLSVALGRIDAKVAPSNFAGLVQDLLKTWCDGMISHQINDPSDPERHGCLWCPACQKIHGRCMDAVYPFMHMAHTTGDDKYLNAAIDVMAWSKNVSKDDGSWTVIPDPNSWAGITVFGAIALGEALYFHGEILPPDIRQIWTARLAKATQYVYENFDLTFTNINYGFTAIYALNFLGKLLEEKKYIERSRALAKGAKAFFTEPNLLIWGEGKPSARKTDKGLPLIDLGYNVEETLNGITLYALDVNDTELLALVEKSLDAHLAFMLPDGAWDNCWGTRQAKWSYWGSRTTDGCQPAYGLMAKHNPVFGTAAFRNTQLLAECTDQGLLHGGPHYVSHGVLPCIHHTFAHAKPMAMLLDKKDVLANIKNTEVLPRETAQGITHYPELDVWLLAKGDWRPTVSAYDGIYKADINLQQASGGTLGMVWHELTGPLMVASMAEYNLIEKNNQQPQPDNEDIALTPRIETFSESGDWFTNLYDLNAKVDATNKNSNLVVDVITQLRNEKRKGLQQKAEPFQLAYSISKDILSISAERHSSGSTSPSTRLVLPIISPSHEKIVQQSDNQVAFIKKACTVVVESTSPIKLRKTKKARVFNMVPGMEAVILDVDLPQAGQLTCDIRVIA